MQRTVSLGGMQRRTNDPWTPDEGASLRDMAAQGKSWLQIAIRPRRTLNAVKTSANSLGLRPGAAAPGILALGRAAGAVRRSPTLRRLVGRLGPLRLLLLQLDRLRGRLRRFVPPLFPRLVTALAAFVDPGPGSRAERMDEGQENRGVATPAAGDAVSVADHTNAFPAQSRMRAKGRMSHSGVISGWSRTLLAAFPDAGILRRTGLPAAWSCVAPARSTSWPRS